MSPDEPRSFLSELKRRHVFRVGVAYAVFAAGLIQLADIVVPRLGGSDETVTLIIRVALIGLPVALVLAWLYDITSAGITRTTDATPTAGQPAPRVVMGKREALSLAGAALLLLLVVGAAGIALLHRQTEKGYDNNRFSVLPFRVQGNPGIKYLDEAVVDLISTKLNGAGDLVSVDPKPLLGFIHRAGAKSEDDRELGQAVSRRFHAGLFIGGAVVQTGSTLQLIASLYDHSGKVLIDRATTTCTEDQVSAGLDELARKLLAGISPDGSHVARLSEVTTDSLEALKAYLRGERFVRSASIPAAVAEFKKAIAIDSTFALAYLHLAIADSWMPRASPDFRLGQSAATRRMAAHADRLSSSDRLIADVFVAFQYGDFRECIPLTSRILQGQPENIDALYFLGECRFHEGPAIESSRRDAKNAFARVLTLDPGHSFALEHMADIAVVERDTLALDSLVNAVARLLPERATAYRALQSIARRPLDAARSLPADLKSMSDEELTDFAWRALGLSPTPQTIEGISAALVEPQRSEIARVLGDQYHTAGDLATGRIDSAVARIVMHLQSQDSTEAARWSALASAAIMLASEKREQLQKVLMQTTKNIALTSKTAPLIAFVGSFGGDPRVEEAARMMESRPDSAPPMLVETTLNRAYSGKLAAARYRVYRDYLSGKCDRVERAGRMSRNFTFSLWISAECDHASTSADASKRALAAYSAQPTFHTTSLLEFPMAPIAAARMAEIYERQGKFTEAKTQYARFLSFWDGHADAAHQGEISRVRARIAALSNK